MTICCLDCFHRTGKFVPATNLGDRWRCDGHAEAAWLRYYGWDE